MSTALPTISVVARQANASEIAPTTSGMGQFMVNRSGSTAKALTVDYSFWKGDTAKAGVDFQTVSGVLKIAAGRNYGFVDIVPIAQKKADAQRSVKLVLNSGKYQISKSSAQVTIESNATPQATVSVTAKANASEIDPAGGGVGQFMVTRSGSTAEALTVDYSLSSADTAVSGEDFEPISGTLKIAAGRSYGFVDIDSIAGVTAPTRSVQLVLEGGSYQIGQGSAQITIAAYSPTQVAPPAPPAPPAPVLPTISIVASGPNASEIDPTGTGAGTYTVTRTGSTADDLTVNYSMDASSTAVAGTNYQSLGGTVTIPAGESSATITLTPIDVGFEAPDTTVCLDLTGSATYSIASSQNSATITIANTDVLPGVSIVATQANTPGANPSTAISEFTVARTGPTTNSLEVYYYEDSSGTALGNTDYQALGGTVTIPAGQSSATIPVISISSSNATRNVVLDLHANGSYVIAPQDASATVYVANVAQVNQNASQLPAGEPALTAGDNVDWYLNLATEPLYSSGGPQIADVHQAGVGDCILMSQLAEIAKLDPSAITQAIHENSDGTYDVFLHNNGQLQDIHIDGWVPCLQYDSLDLQYAGLGQSNATWVAVLEKAIAIAATGPKALSTTPSYENLTGSPIQAYTALGVGTPQINSGSNDPTDWTVTSNGSQYYTVFNSAIALASDLANAIAAGDAVDLGTWPDTIVPGPIVAQHNFSVLSVTTDNSGEILITMRDPDGRGGDDGHGAVTYTAEQVCAQMDSFEVCSI